MAEVYALGRGEFPPDKEDWVLVEKTATNGYLVHTCSAGSKDASFAYHGPFASVDNALDRAHQLADEMGTGLFYTLGLLGG